MAWTKQQGTKHSAACTRAFAFLSPLGACPRCDELRAGARPREGWNSARIEADAAKARHIAAHFAQGGKHSQILAAGGMDTTFDY